MSKRSDGFYGWSFRGPLSRPEIFPAGIGGAAPASGGFGLARRPSRRDDGPAKRASGAAPHREEPRDVVGSRARARARRRSSRESRRGVTPSTARVHSRATGSRVRDVGRRLRGAAAMGAGDSRGASGGGGISPQARRPDRGTGAASTARRCSRRAAALSTSAFDRVSSRVNRSVSPPSPSKAFALKPTTRPSPRIRTCPDESASSNRKTTP